jgi:hypothetical protein
MARPAAQGWRTRHGRQVIPARLPHDLFIAISAHATLHGMSFNHALIDLVSRALDADRRRQRRQRRAVAG